MATWYTDNLTGNDTTGNGTIATPYKTIRKAAEVAANGDTINVAGSGWTPLTGTFAPFSISSTTFNSGAGVTDQLAVNDLISFDDPIMGNEKLIMKVNTKSAGGIQSNVPYGSDQSFGFRKLTQIHYSTATANTTFEDLSTGAAQKLNLKIEGGWINNFTEQTGITAMVYNATSQSGTGFRFNTGTQNGNETSINRFAFVNLNNQNAILSGTPAMGVQFGNIWFSNCGITGAQILVYNMSSTPMNLHIAHSNGFNTAPYLTNIPYVSNIYQCGGLTPGPQVGKRGAMIIENLWHRPQSSAANSPATALASGRYEVKNYNLIWNTTTSFQAAVLAGGAQSSNVTLRNLNQYNEGINKVFSLISNDASICNWVNTSINVDNIASLSTGYNQAIGINSFNAQIKYCPVLDSEGNKLLWMGGVSTFADSTVFDTGTNSLRIRRQNANVNNDVAFVPIKSIYIPVGSTTAKTFRIRTKSTGNNITKFCIQAPSTFSAADATTPTIPQEFTVTSSWANYNYTLTSSEVTALAGTYIVLAIIPNGNWAQTYVWIDSVTEI